MSFAIRQAWPTDLDAVARVATEAQADPQRFNAYLGDDAASIAADLTEIDGVRDWTQATLVALDDQRNMIGWIATETDADLGRTWWWGPFISDGQDALAAPIADALFTAAERSVEGDTEHEMAVDGRSSLLRAFAERHGFVAEEGSVVLNTADLASVSSGPSTGVVVAPMAAHQRDAVAALHDEIFPGTHTPGSLLVGQTDDRHRRFVAEVHGADMDGAVAGYVATILQNDGSLYIDYLGVDAAHRGAGIGRSLITAAMHAVDGVATHAHLTVRASNTAARRLYASLGFVEERVLVPMRRGFSLA